VAGPADQPGAGYLRALPSLRRRSDPGSQKGPASSKLYDTGEVMYLRAIDGASGRMIIPVYLNRGDGFRLGTGVNGMHGSSGADGGARAER